MEPHKIIWLQPSCEDCAGKDRMWCQDNVWDDRCEECGAQPVKYVLAPDQPQPLSKDGQ